MLTAEIVSVGTEILMGQIVDRNAAVLGELFAEFGIRHVFRQTVGDNLERLTGVLRVALDRSDVVFTIGGLGPTQDDLTRDGIAAALDDELVRDPAIEASLRAIFEGRKLVWTESQFRQAMRPSCGEALPNPNGTAPGLMCSKGGKTVFALPGPTNEFVPMVNGPVRERLAALSGGIVFHSRVVRVAGIGEALAEEKLGGLVHSENPTVAPYAKTAEVHFRVTARASTLDEAETMLAPVLEEFREKLGEHIYGYDECSLEETVLALLRDRSETLAVAESCTGGGLGRRITSVAGSSDVFLGGVISYANQVKQDFLGVSVEVLETEGAVSEACATAMAEGIRARMGASWGISITGVAGPGGGTEAKPVGLVYVGVAGPHGTAVHRLNWRGSREIIRDRSVQSALYQLWLRTKKSPLG